MEAVGEGFQVQFWSSEPLPRARELLVGSPCPGQSLRASLALLRNTGPCVGLDGFFSFLQNASQGSLLHPDLEEMWKVQLFCPEWVFSSLGFSDCCLISSKSPCVPNPDVTPLIVARYPARFLA